MRFSVVNVLLAEGLSNLVKLRQRVSRFMQSIAQVCGTGSNSKRSLFHCEYCNGKFGNWTFVWWLVVLKIGGR